MYCLMTRFVLVTIVMAFLQINTLQVQVHVSAYEVNLKEAKKDKALYGQAFLNLTQTPTLAECFDYCVKNCRCTAFQIFQKTECQLLSSNRFLTPSSFLSKQGYTYYDMSPRKQATSLCESVIDCCTTSKPCLNGGTCLPPLPNTRKRYRCNCPDGYTGEQCKQQVRSCRGYSDGSRIPGNYSVFDANNKTFKVFCDFDMNSSMTWTLIQSYSFNNNGLFKFQTLLKNVPKNENDPSWLKYRLSKSRMESIQQDSTKWRITCRYETDGVVYRDYVRAKTSNIDPMSKTADGGECFRVEYINIRGYECVNCTVLIAQLPRILHFDSYHSHGKGCNFKAKKSLYCSGSGEDNFGNYECHNPEHRCSSSQEATTQTWFGGK